MINDDVHLRDTLIAEVVRRATIDRVFREWLLRDPHAALGEVLGMPVPKRLKIRCIEKEADVDALIVLPDFKGTE